MLVKIISFVYLRHHLIYPSVGAVLIALSYFFTGDWQDWLVCAGLSLMTIFWYGAYTIRKKRVNALYGEQQSNTGHKYEKNQQD